MTQPWPVILASASPRRRELLGQLGVSFQVRAAAVDESPRPGEAADSYVLRVARDKADAAFTPGALALGADTVVVVDGRILGKPRGRSDGLAMLASLSGRAHQVFTAVVVAGPRHASRLSVSEVRFRATSRGERERYWDSGEPQDKAGAYAIQGLGAIFIEHLKGSYSGVMGLPLFETAELLREFGVDILEGLPRRPVLSTDKP